MLAVTLAKADTAVAEPSNAVAAKDVVGVVTCAEVSIAAVELFIKAVAAKDFVGIATCAEVSVATVELFIKAVAAKDVVGVVTSRTTRIA